MTEGSHGTIADQLRGARMGCQVLSAHVDRVSALLADSAATTQANLRRGLTTLREMRRDVGTVPRQPTVPVTEEPLDIIERALLDCSLYLKEHDVIRQYQAIISSAIGGVAERLEGLDDAIPQEARHQPVEIPEAILDYLWTRYVSDEQRAVHRQHVDTDRPLENAPLPKIQLF